MSYQDEANLAKDPDFTARLQACLCEEAQAKPDDPLATYVLTEPYLGMMRFMPWISTAPGFGDAYSGGGQEAVDDAMMLAAVQSVWASVPVPTS